MTMTIEYHRGQDTARKRVARLTPGDRVLTGYPGHDEFVRTPGTGDIVLVQEAGSITSHLLVRHVEDTQLRPVGYKVGALVASVTDVRRINGLWLVDTDIGDLPPLSGQQAVTIVLESAPWPR